MIIRDVKEAKKEESRDEIVDLKSGKVERKLLIMPRETGGPGIVKVFFSKGAKLNFHTHTGDQICYITSGKGIMATKEKEWVVTPDTVVFIPAGEVHYHGATLDSDCEQVCVYHGTSKAV